MQDVGYKVDDGYKFWPFLLSHVVQICSSSNKHEGDIIIPVTPRSPCVFTILFGWLCKRELAESFISS